MNIPINHKTIFLFDHCTYFASSSNARVDIDLASLKNKPHPSAQAQRLEPLNKTLWTCSLEAAIEYARIVYDLFPDSKLIRMIVTKFDCALNSWNLNDQGLDHLMNIMGNVMPPLPQTRQLFEGEEFINLCKSLNIAVNSIAQTSELQQALSVQAEARQAGQGRSVPNSGRIVLFSSASNRNIEQVQEFLAKAIEECNKNIEQLMRSEQMPPSCLRINKIELVFVDVVPCDYGLLYEKEIVKLNSGELRTRICSSHAGKSLPLKLIDLVKKFYELTVTSVTNIPMKEELNANSSANYDVDILHVRSLHDQLKVCQIFKNCTSMKDGKETVCLKWSNPKTNITEFNFSSSSSRITPIDVNSRPASCLTSFLLGGRCVVLEVPRASASNTRISSHVLCAQGNEIFMHCLNCCGKSSLDERTSIGEGARLAQYRTNEFAEFIRLNTLSHLPPEIAFSPGKCLARLEKQTRKWPITYDETLVGNFFQLSKLLRNIAEEKITDNQLVESIQHIDYFQQTDLKAESLISPAQAAGLKKTPDRDVKAQFWNELEEWLRAYQDVSDKHKALYNHAKKIRDNFVRTMEGAGPRLVEVETAGGKREAGEEMETEKLGRRRRFVREQRDEKSLLEFWQGVLGEKAKGRIEFYGRAANPTGITPLYTHLMDESKRDSGKMEMT